MEKEKRFKRLNVTLFKKNNMNLQLKELQDNRLIY